MCKGCDLLALAQSDTVIIVSVYYFISFYYALCFYPKIKVNKLANWV